MSFTDVNDLCKNIQNENAAKRTQRINLEDSNSNLKEPDFTIMEQKNSLNKISNSSKENNHGSKADGDHHGEESGFEKFLHVLELICEYGSTSILSLFMVEITAKLIFNPKSFFKCLELMDAFIVTISFGLNLYLIITHVEIHSVASLFTILRYS